MRKVKFIGNAGYYRWDIKPVKGQLYDEDYRSSYNGNQYKPLNWVGEGEREVWVDNPEDWELVEDDRSEVDKLIDSYIRLSQDEKSLFKQRLIFYEF